MPQYQTLDESSNPRPRKPDRPPSRSTSGAHPPPSDALDADEDAVEALYGRLFGEPAVDPPDHHGFFVTTLDAVLRWPQLLGTLKAIIRVVENLRMERARPFDYETGAAGGDGR